MSLRRASPAWPKGVCPEIVPQTDRLDEVTIETERAPDVPRNARHQLHVEATAREIVVAAEAEHLRLAVEAAVGGQMHDLLGITHVRRTPDATGVTCARLAANRRIVGGAIRIDPSSAPILLHTLDQLGAQLVGHGE